MRNPLQLKRAFWLWLLTIWSTTAWAAQSTFAADLSSIPLEAIKWTVLLSFIGGAASTTNKIAAPDVVVRSIPLEILKDVMASLVAGLVTFFLCSWINVPYWLQAALITLAGYGGSKALDQLLVNGLFAWFEKMFGRLTGKETQP